MRNKTRHVKVTNGQLSKWTRDLSDVNQSVLGVLLSGKIKKFVEANGLRMQELGNKINAIVKAYYAEPEYKDLLEGKTREDFEKEMRELMAQENTIEI